MKYQKWNIKSPAEQDIALLRSAGYPYLLSTVLAARGICSAETAAECLDNIVSLRDVMAANGIWPSYTYVMNLLGYEGCHYPDYCVPVKTEYIPKIREMLQKIGEL